MFSSVSVRLLELDGYCLDLRHVSFENETGLDLIEYIVFLNVKCSIFRNFHVRSDLSLESLALHIFRNVRYRIDGREMTTANKSFVDYIFHDEHDRDAMHIKLHPWLRVVVAKKLRSSERYHQRITGFMDFEKRLQNPPDTVALLTDYNSTRDILDSFYEKNLFEHTDED
ncbi:ORF69 [Leucania separata nucleopolyhedrovirus]|uniref:ORF69 n=1 Tax=Leucania separata nucleopolyhedrovirus TaxID=1307956 RepID=Q0IL50_NPVLS|nr:ORF69 [Leucania separata nucleopolyhedrovirus]AAR28833.1 ORF69 [Leucania separata nucleopolyhedrovirus]